MRLFFDLYLPYWLLFRVAYPHMAQKRKGDSDISGFGFAFSGVFLDGNIGAMCPTHSRQHRGLDNVQSCTINERVFTITLLDGKDKCKIWAAHIHDQK